MATAEELLEGSCETGVSSLAPTQLWVVIAQAMVEASGMTVDEILEAACADGVAYLAPEQLLVIIAEVQASGGGGGGGSGQIKTYIADPNGEGVVPDDQTKPAVAYAAAADGPTVTWNTGTLLWQ